MSEKFSKPDYLKQHLDRPIKREELSRDQFIDPVFSDPIGGRNLVYEDLIEAKVEDENVSLILGLNKNLGNTFPRELFQYADYIKENDLRSVTELRIVNKKNDKEFLLTEILPHGWRVFFEPGSKHAGWVDDETKTVYINGDFAYPKTLLALLHEIGHVKDAERKTKEQVAEIIEANDKYFDALKNNRFMSSQMAEIQLRSERDAWAFALKQARKIFPHITYNQYRTLIHDAKLGMYSDFIRFFVKRKKND